MGKVHVYRTQARSQLPKVIVFFLASWILKREYSCYVLWRKWQQNPRQKHARWSVKQIQSPSSMSRAQFAIFLDRAWPNTAFHCDSSDYDRTILGDSNPAFHTAKTTAWAWAVAPILKPAFWAGANYSKFSDLVQIMTRCFLGLSSPGM